VTPIRRRLHSEQGDAGPLEVVILVPVVLLVFALVVAFSRTTTATEHVAHAAAVGARAAASAQTAGGATALATDVVADALAQVGMSCGPPAVAGTFTPGGSVTVTVSCAVDLGDLTAFGAIPGSRTLTASATELIDRTRGGRT
jgi:Flp pilus assembly protein TadG